MTQAAVSGPETGWSNLKNFVLFTAHICLTDVSEDPGWQWSQRLEAPCG